MLYTSNILIEAIKRNASIPTSQKKFSPDDFLAFLNEELSLTIVGELMSQQNDYFITTVDTPILADTSTYSMPTTSVGWKLDSVGWVDGNDKYTRLNQVPRSQRQLYTSLATSTNPQAFYVSGNDIILLPSISSSPIGSVRFDHVQLQNDLVLTSACGLISNVAESGTDYLLTVNQSPILTNNVDVVNAVNPFAVIARNQTATEASLVITVAQANFDQAPVEGDYVCERNKTPIPNIPEDFHPCLAQAAAIRCLISMNDEKGLKTARISLANQFKTMKERISRRVNTAPVKIVSSNRILNLMR